MRFSFWSSIMRLTESWQYECFTKTSCLYQGNVKRWHQLIKEKGILHKRPYLHVPLLPNPIYNPMDNVFCLHYLFQMVSQLQVHLTLLQWMRIRVHKRMPQWIPTLINIRFYDFETHLEIHIPLQQSCRCNQKCNLLIYNWKRQKYNFLDSINVCSQVFQFRLSLKIIMFVWS